MTHSERKALVKSYLGKIVKIQIDRPIGYVHKKESYTLTYPINYGYIPDVYGGDGEELDVYLIGIDRPLKSFTARIVGIVHRHNDVEDKLIAAPDGKVFYQNEIAEQIDFQEKYYETHIESLHEKSCGGVVYTKINGEINYLLIKSPNGDMGFPKGHIESGETEIQTAYREILEETSIKVDIKEGFRTSIDYIMHNGKHKTAVYFLAEYKNQMPRHNDGFEFNEYFLLPYEDAVKALTFDNMKKVLLKANLVLNGK